LISTELDEYIVRTKLGHTGPSIERLQMRPIGLTEVRQLVAELNIDIDLMHM
jgi:hypothetical protein